MSGVGRDRMARNYRPKVEALEALRLLDAGMLPSAFGPTAVVEPVAWAQVESAPNPGSLDEAAWDAALDQSLVADLLLDPEAAQADLDDGLSQLGRYLGRAWGRAGIAPQHYDDCTQTVYETLLENLGRDGFEDLTRSVGRRGVRDVLGWETPQGPDFFRAVDMVKKRFQRIKTFQTLDEHYAELTDAAGTDGAAADWRVALDEAIDKSLSPREASLIRETLLGKTPAEIAGAWGMAPKTVSNEKTRAIQKLREALLDAA